MLDPDRSANETAIFWRPELVATVLMLEAAPSVFRMARRLEQLDLTHATLHAQPEGEGAIVLADPDGDHYWVADAIDSAQPPAVLLPLDDNFHIRAEAALRFQRRLFGRAAGPLPRAHAHAASPPAAGAHGARARWSILGRDLPRNRWRAFRHASAVRHRMENVAHPRPDDPLGQRRPDDDARRLSPFARWPLTPTRLPSSVTIRGYAHAGASLRHPP